MDEQAGSIDLGCHVRELERDGLVHDDRFSKRGALLCVLERDLVRAARHTEGLSADSRPSCFEGLHRRLSLSASASFARTGELRVEAFLAAKQAAIGDAYIVEHHFGGVAGFDAVLFVLLAL